MMTMIGYRLGLVASIVTWIVPGVACVAVTPAVAQDEISEAGPDVSDAEPQVSGQALDAASRAEPADTPAMDELDLRRTEITGNQELPKVLYIVPWQKSDPGNLLGRPVNTLLDEVLAPLDREEFIRQVDYYSDVEGAKEAL